VKDWLLKMAKRRGTAHTRKLAQDFQAPYRWPSKIEPSPPLYDEIAEATTRRVRPTLAGLTCERCGRPLDPIHNCEVFSSAQQRHKGEK
jgi:hypothetical protein